MIRMYAAAVIALLVLTACDDFAFRDTGAYTYIAAPNLQPGLVHEFADGPGSFAGTCEATPTFLVMDGDWDKAATRFAVTVDGRTRAFEIVPGMDTPTLALLPDGSDGSEAQRRDKAAIGAMLANAATPIVFSVGAWRRSAPPSPEIARFIAACREWRATRPATG